MTAKELREKRAKLVADARKMHQEHGGSPETWTAERSAQFDKMIDDAQKLAADIARLESLQRLETEPGEQNPLGAGAGAGAKPGEAGASTAMVHVRAGSKRGGVVEYVDRPAGRRGSANYRLAVAEYLAGGGLSPERRANLQSDVDIKGGYLVVSEQFAAGLLQTLDDELFVRRYADVITVPMATTLGIRRRVGKMSTFAYGTELQVQANDTSLTFGKKVLTPHDLTGSCRISRDNLRRNVLGAEAIVRAEMARDAGEVQEDKFFFGTGPNMPLGVFVASVDGISTARDVLTGSATDITADGLIDAKFALKANYRQPSGTRSGARWLFHRDAIKRISKLKDTTNQYLYIFSLREGEPDTLLGLPVDESERTPNTFTAGLYVGLLAQWFYYKIADALDMEIQVLDQLYAETNEVGYIGRLKNDGMPVLEEAFVRLRTN